MFSSQLKTARPTETMITRNGMIFLSKTRASGFHSLVSIISGMVISAFIVWTISIVQSLKPQEEPEHFEDLRSIAIPPPPPPPLRAKSPMKAAAPDLMDLEISETESMVKIVYTPELEKPSIHPPESEPTFDFSLESFKPGSNPLKSNHAFKVAEVDQPPIAVYKKRPNLNKKMVENVDIPRVRVIYLVMKDGSVESVSLVQSANQDFDKEIIKTVRKWRFKPAMKDGEKVRCWVRHGFRIKAGKSSPFSA